MKRWMALLLALVMAAGLAACGGRDGEGTPEDGKPSVAAPEEPGGQDQPAPVQPEEPVGTGEEPVLPDQPPEADGDEAGGTAGDSRDIGVSHEDVTLFSAGETFTLSVQNVGGTYACSFTSADPEVAEADEQTGTVTAVAPGMTTVTAHLECESGQYDFACIVRCSWEAEEPVLPGSDTAADLPALEDFFASLQSSYEGLDAMMVMDGELLDNYYPGLSGIAAVEEMLIQETKMSTANVAVGLVKLSDDAVFDDFVAVMDVLNARITAQAGGGAWYPASCETWEQGTITSVSRYVGMFVYPDGAQAMAELFTQTYSN